ncbi:MAG: type II toxin-antitoxin system HicA family toxin, partial [Syntrophomonadaceae bacterium]|nr:type II toxin-antitoxin system HicA family toxin [Syntrophomonadaceae bacterium]
MSLTFGEKIKVILGRRNLTLAALAEKMGQSQPDMNDGWTLKTIKGSHHQYVHPTKPGKVTIPCHSGD